MKAHGPTRRSDADADEESCDMGCGEDAPDRRRVCSSARLSVKAQLPYRCYSEISQTTFSLGFHRRRFT